MPVNRNPSSLPATYCWFMKIIAFQGVTNALLSSEERPKNNYRACKQGASGGHVALLSHNTLSFTVRNK